ncbi:lipopolysaccharide transport periplasmic protein LptA [Pikeienuella piscinae]|uniref:Lipopolysaccharide transport periplasmic protein LptA n=1 Tax=Pikeienuella piscinae TaxID=2748098 RepID=A0A7L5BXN1_9RHOB|nr:lipopolysaccharide transport periplasmic protein LptA [Pikeienuella piscinae]QIE54359.1 lipopolysaccharide transport periplasmic protein LptA [Pikeienuella piscinae]
MMTFARGAAFAALLIAGLTAGLASDPAAAQSTSPFGGFKHDRTQPIEIAADSLEVRESQNIAIFKGGVVAGQGTLKLTADELEVHYGDGGAGTGQIRLLEARGDVFLSNQEETAAGDVAEYDVAAGAIRMTGGVTLTQGGNVVKGAALSIDLNTGEGRVDGGGGRVKSVFTPAPKDPPKAAD